MGANGIGAKISRMRSQYVWQNDANSVSSGTRKRVFEHMPVCCIFVFRVLCKSLCGIATLSWTSNRALETVGSNSTHKARVPTYTIEINIRS